MTVHQPVLLRQVMELLLPPFREAEGDAWLVDCTLGGGGHASAMLEAFAREGLERHKVLAIDRDPGAVERARARFAPEIRAGRLTVAHRAFSTAAEEIGSRRVLGILADIGFSSDQVDDRERGFSFLGEGPLDMRLDPSRGQTCRELLASVTERELERILVEFGEERFARRIASGIVRARSEGALPATTSDLSRVVARSVPAAARHGRIHVATRTFQALRIAVNDELGELDALLERVILSLSPGGRMAVISFHSLEDRKVKLAMKAFSTGETPSYRVLTKKPVVADDAENAANSRARSAKLRVIERNPE